MKKQYLYGAAAATLMLAACSQDEVVSMKQDGINYTVFAKNQTRAADSYCNAILPKYFNVYARTSTDGAAYINGDKIENKSGVWTDADGVRYWPQEGNLDFFAHVNGEGVFAYNNGAPKFNGFVVKSAVGEQLDLMYAVNPNVAKSSGPVALNFRHALSQVCFRANNTTKNLKITINSVSVGHLYGKGTYTFPSVNTNDNVEDTDHNDAYDNIEYYPDNRGGWDPEDAANNEYLAGVLGGSVVMVPGTTNVNLTCPGNTTHENGFSKVLTLLPQDQTAWTPVKGVKGAPNGAYFVLNVVLENRVHNGVDTDDNPVYVDTPAYTGNVYVPVEISWKEGYRYIYTFNFNEGTNGGWTDPEDPDDPDGPKPALTGIDYAVTIDDFIPVSGDDPNGSEVEAYMYNANVKLYNNLPDETESYANVTVKTNDKPFGLVLSSYEPAAKDGYTFAGWATSAELAKAGTVAYQKNATFSIDFAKSDYALYAVWTATTIQPTTYTVTYTDGVDGEEVFKDQFKSAEAGTATPAFEGTPTRAGYTFVGWSPAVAATVTDNATYTAKWEPNKFTLNLNGNAKFGGDVTNMPTIDPVSEAIEGPYEFTIPEGEPVYKDYVFAGWSTDSNAQYDDEDKIKWAGQKVEVSKNSTLILYAVWASSGTVVNKPNTGQGSL